MREEYCFRRRRTTGVEWPQMRKKTWQKIYMKLYRSTTNNCAPGFAYRPGGMQHALWDTLVSRRRIRLNTTKWQMEVTKLYDKIKSRSYTPSHKFSFTYSLPSYSLSLSMHSRVCVWRLVTVGRLSVSLLSHRSTAATATGGFAAERPVGRRYRSIAAGALRAPCCRRRRTAANGAQQLMRAASHWQTTKEAEHRLVFSFVFIKYSNFLQYLCFSSFTSDFIVYHSQPILTSGITFWSTYWTLKKTHSDN